MQKQPKFFLYSTIICLIFTKADLTISQTLDEELKECSEITVSLIRLQCYDRLAKAPEVASAQPAAQPKRRSLFQRQMRDNRAQRQQQQTSTNVESEQPEVVAQSQNKQSSDSFGKVNEEEANEITSRILGQFDGWTGDTLFRLENGQVWRQSGNGFLKVSMNNPKVTIEKAVFGGFRLSIEGYNSRVKVKRVQ